MLLKQGKVYFYSSEDGRGYGAIYKYLETKLENEHIVFYYKARFNNRNFFNEKNVLKNNFIVQASERLDKLSKHEFKGLFNFIFS